MINSSLTPNSPFTQRQLLRDLGL